LNESKKRKKLSELSVKIFADGADIESILPLYDNPLIKGFTTNPTLMRKAGVRDYRLFAQNILEKSPIDRFVSKCFLTILERWRARRWKWRHGALMFG
jgi:transaldolase